MVFIALCLVKPPAFVTKSKFSFSFTYKIVLHSVNEGDSTNPEDSTEKKPEPTANTEENASEESKEEAPSDEESEHTEL